MAIYKKNIENLSHDCVKDWQSLIFTNVESQSFISVTKKVETDQF